MNAESWAIASVASGLVSSLVFLVLVLRLINDNRRSIQASTEQIKANTPQD